MKKFIYSIAFIFSIGLFISCDKIEEPFIEEIGDCGDASLPVPIKQILIEEYTGHQCGNCPRGAETIQTIKEAYCDHVIPISIHAGSFADVYQSGKYTYEYRTDLGNSLNEYYEATAAGVPNAIINRTQFNNSYSQNYANWLTIVADLLNEAPVVDIVVDTRINTDKRELDIDVDVVFISSINSDLMLSVYFVEDSIISWQKDYSLENEDIEFYSHNHVLRDAVNGVWGDEILKGNANSGDVKSKSYTYKVNEEWKVENSSLVVFVYKSENREILQATQEHLF
ncbi:MAG: Omp28 family outer membrane lipoprotein [Bacteroidales bacterium]|nr:Omp28 family outer membrane lipoprotein [Bacteroidales bacterium]